MHFKPVIVVEAILTKLHNLPGDSAAWIGGAIGGGWAFLDNVRIYEWIDFGAHALVGGIISYLVKKGADALWVVNQQKEKANNNEHE